MPINLGPVGKPMQMGDHYPMNADTISWFPIVLGVLAAIAIVALLVAFAVRRSKTRKLPPPTPSTVADVADEPPVPITETVTEVDVATETAEGEIAEVAIEPAVEPDVVTEESLEVPQLDVPEAPATRMQRLRARLSRSGSLGSALLSVLSRGDLSAGDWEEIEDSLLLADVGLPATEEILDRLRTEVKVRGKVSSDEARELLHDVMLELVQPEMDRALNLDATEGNPANVLVVGVNGTGKTTTVGKLGRLLRAEDRTVLMGAADTFRAAAAEQLETWGERVGVEVVRSDREGGDPAAVAFETVQKGKADGVDVVLVDTAGRLQTKATLMDELSKVRRVMERQAPVTEVLLVLDATTGQNGMRQAQVFAEAVGITGVVLTKLDGSAKGGIVISVQRELGVPVKLVGLGEGPDDLAPFDPESFVDAIISG